MWHNWLRNVDSNQFTHANFAFFYCMQQFDAHNVS